MEGMTDDAIGRGMGRRLGAGTQLAFGVRLRGATFGECGETPIVGRYHSL